MLRAALLLGLASGIALADDDDKLTPRGIVRTGSDSTGKVIPGSELAKTGLKQITAFSQKIVLLQPDGSVKNVKPEDHVFKVGEKFRISIEADTEVYVFVYHEGPNGEQSILLPDERDQGKVPKVLRGERKVLPDDGTWFECRPPVGKERILVYGSAEKKDAMSPRDAWAENANRLKGLSKVKTPEKTVTATSPKQVAAANQGLQEFRMRGLSWKPAKPNEDGSTLTAQGSYDENIRPDKFEEIVLSTKQ